jgi:methylated-DNA-[protein]-cysteine S-methyltransferase
MLHPTDQGKYHCFDSPMGLILVAEKNGNLVRVDFMERFNQKVSSFLTEGFIQEKTQLLSLTRKQLEEYFQGKRTNFDLPYYLEGTAFQKEAWKALLKIRYGDVWSYSKQSSLMGKPNAFRAVGQANGRNSLPIIIPCHRVTGKNGSLTGYRSGLDRKQRLLELEKRFNPVQNCLF